MPRESRTFALIGLSHHTAPIEVRERAALGREAAEALLRELVSHPHVSEAVVISTCNRVEIAACAPASCTPEEATTAITQILCRHTEPLEHYLYRHVNRDGLMHLFRVASSLDSLVVGEPQILGQLKQAVDVAREAGTLGPLLSRVTTHAVRVAKRVRTETALGAGQVSVPSIAIDLTRQIFGDLSKRKAALVGTGDMGQAVAKQLRSEGASIAVLGRSSDKVAELASEIGGEPRDMAALDATLVEADVIVTTTSANHYIIDYDKVSRLKKSRKGRSLFLIDLSVPRNVDPRVDGLDNVFLYNIDDLSQIVSQSLSSRRQEADRAEAIVLEEAQSFERAASAEQVTPTVVALRQRMRGLLAAELEKSRKSTLKHLVPSDDQALDKMLDAAVNKILHVPTRRLRELASDPDSAVELDALVATLTELFELDSMEPPAPRRGSIPPKNGSIPPKNGSVPPKAGNLSLVPNENAVALSEPPATGSQRGAG
jgi:glutamyl-tRNA reductase